VERNGLSFENNSLLQSRELIDRIFIIPGAIGDIETIQNRVLAFSV
jgi:hypothetical protein